MTFSVIWDTWSSTGRLLTQQIEPTEKTAPPRVVSKCTTWAPPSSGFSPLASSRALGGELGESLSVSCPEAPPGHRRCSDFRPKRSPSFRPVRS